MNAKSPTEEIFSMENPELHARLQESGEEMLPAIGEATALDGVLDAIPANVAILNADGEILRVNNAWIAFAEENGVSPHSVAVGVNYLAACDAATGPDREAARNFAFGIRLVIGGQCERFNLEYPCHSPLKQRWFIGYVTAMAGPAPGGAVVAHVDISVQKMIEEQVRTLNEQLESRVIERTSELFDAVNALEKEIIQRQELEREILGITERATTRVGRDLHDGLCQTLSGIGFLARALQRRIESGKLPPQVAAAETGKIVDLIRDATNEARELASGMYPVCIEEYGLAAALEKFAFDTSHRFHVTCRFASSRPPVQVRESHAATHLYRIAQEAVSNAINHGQANAVLISLAAAGNGITLKIEDNGHGQIEDIQMSQTSGMGLKTMNYRARVIGGSFNLCQRNPNGLAVICMFPM